MRTLLAFSLVAVLFTSCGSGRRSCDPCDQVVKKSYVHKYGVEVNQHDWNQRGSHGKVISTQKNGVVVTKNYVQGKLDGETSYTFPHSKEIATIEVYKADALIQVTTNFLSGNRKEEVRYNPNASDTEMVTNYYESGKIRAKEVFEQEYLLKGDYFTLNGEKESVVVVGTGMRINRDSLGTLTSSENFLDGDAVKETFFHSNGSPKEIVAKLQGVFDGLRVFYLPGGEPLKTEMWINGKQTGITTTFQNGERVTEASYLNGLKHGVEKRYRDDDFVVEEISWMKGRQHGPTHTYFGADTTVDWYWNGKSVKKSQYDRLASPRMQ